MKQFIVSISARSRTLDPAEITRFMGINPTECHKRGDLSIRGNASYIDNFWWLDSGAGHQATMNVHGESLMSCLTSMSPSVFELTSIGDLDVSIGVGILSDSYTTSVRLPRELVDLASRIGASFEVSYYPTDFS